MNLPAGWSEAITTSPLLLACLILVGASLVVLFLAPFFFNLAKKAEFPERLMFIKKYPRCPLAGAWVKKSLEQKKYFRLSILVFLILVSIIASATIIFTKQTKKSDEPPIVNPSGKAAFKYYPEGGNSPDFRDGSNGPLEVKMERKADRVILSWDSSVKVSVVKAFDLGKIYKLGDQKLVWQIQNDNPKNPSASADPSGVSYISSPYTLGEKPKGFFLTAGNQNLKLTSGARYSIELMGVTEQSLPTLGVYTFTY